MVPTPSAPPSCVGLRVLLVDDSRVQRVVATNILRNHGLRVTCANDGQEAVNVLENTDFDLVLMDVEMPVMDGFAAIAAIRQRENVARKHTPVVALTSTEQREKCFAVGMDGFLPKPLTTEDLDMILKLVTQIRCRSNSRTA